MKNEKTAEALGVLEELKALGSLSDADIQCTQDGFYAVTKSISDILHYHGITTFPNEQDQERQCKHFFDDWYIYAVHYADAAVYGLYKMREQEWDSDSGIIADGDTPGVTISFISFTINMLIGCIREPSPANRKALGKEINRVVANRGQSHDAFLKRYFVRVEAEGPYLIGELYVSYIASQAQNGKISVPNCYTELYRKSRNPGASPKVSRIPQFLASNNRESGKLICDHSHIFIRDPSCLTEYEKRAILATHTANLTFHSFAAEVRYHARFLNWYWKFPLPFLGGSVYDSAVRADMTIGDKEFEGPAPFYRLDSRCVRDQEKYHACRETQRK